MGGGCFAGEGVCGCRGTATPCPYSLGSWEGARVWVWGLFVLWNKNVRSAGWFGACAWGWLGWSYDMLCVGDGVPGDFSNTLRTS